MCPRQTRIPPISVQMGYLSCEPRPVEYKTCCHQARYLPANRARGNCRQKRDRLKSEPVPLRNRGEQYPQIFFSLITQPSSLLQMLLLQESLLQGLLQPGHQRPEQQFLQPVLPVLPSRLPEQQSSLSGCGVCCPSWSLS